MPHSAGFPTARCNPLETNTFGELSVRWWRFSTESSTTVWKSYARVAGETVKQLDSGINLSHVGGSVDPSGIGAVIEGFETGKITRPADWAPVRTTWRPSMLPCCKPGNVLLA